VDRSSPVPLYFQVAGQLEQMISDGTLLPGDRIANEISLADQLGLSRPTMRQAIQTLVDKGMLVRKRGVGTQVVHAQIRRPVDLTSLNDDLLGAGEKPSTQVLALHETAADEGVADSLKLPRGTPVWSLERLRMVGDEPLALMHNYVPLTVIDLRAIDLTMTGLYAQLRRNGVQIRVAHQSIGARRAEAREARLLGDRKGAPLLTMQRTAYDDSGRAVELGSHLYRPDRYSFETTLVDR